MINEFEFQGDTSIRTVCLQDEGLVSPFFGLHLSSRRGVFEIGKNPV